MAPTRSPHRTASSAVAMQTTTSSKLPCPHFSFGICQSPSLTRIIHISCPHVITRLDCSPVQDRRCPALQPCDGGLKLGSTNGTGCESKMCAYTGYSNTTSLSIHTALVTANETACQQSKYSLQIYSTERFLSILSASGIQVSNGWSCRGRSREVGVCRVHVENVRYLLPHGAHPDLLPLML